MGPNRNFFLLNLFIILYLLKIIIAYREGLRYGIK